jgi:hypothetical protein
MSERDTKVAKKEGTEEKRQRWSDVSLREGTTIDADVVNTTCSARVN